MSTGFPFLVYEADFRLYTVDPAGDPLAEQWLGGCADRIALSGEYRERAVQYHGRRRGVNYHEDESWSIVATDVRAIDLRSNPPRPAVLRRNQQYALVIVWHDKRAGLWLKRCYFGVKAQPANLSEMNIEQTLRFSAEEMIEVAGRQTTPDFNLVREGEVWYVEGSERTLLYTYDPAARAFAVVESDPDRAEILAEVPGELTITMGGEVALRADSAGVQVAEVVAIGGSYLDDSPRLEFWSGNVRCASLSLAALAAPNLLESATPTAAARLIEVFNPGWLFSFTSARAVAPEFIETAP